MHALAERIAEWLVSKSEHPFNQEEIRYGTEVFLGTAVQIALILSIAFLLGLLKETAYSFFAAAVYRRYSGGVHCGKYYRCTIISLVVFLFLAYLVHYIVMFSFIWVFSMTLLVSIGAIIFLVPVDDLKNPIVNQEKKERLKHRTALVLLGLFLMAIVAKILQDINMAYAILIGILWQTFTLTSWGQKFVSTLDQVFAYIEKLFIRKEGQNV
ncbi:MAG: accessory gene regulator B family protein [Syntrophomonas sp.]|uniref:accessory gene regulator ArgB-like protein n=1 Tax=Syntrophomonas sp. TaxID=2053627 RepID=UPI00261677D9|nr:accessory gene regulator B family protein [Syntrophomonas sp.]MDD2511290.1 accessory gene regulator B family protein [Syntrophomonas sp.]MDD3879888.1 accessory gene regulator B family protein [Syntrophomonas sp.]MDD4627243.1 accessory gene regulator B family protein [Syntrophomonas sp.]